MFCLVPPQVSYLTSDVPLSACNASVGRCSMYVFGGTSPDATDNVVAGNELWRLDLGTLVWEHVATGDTARPPRREEAVRGAAGGAWWRC